MFSAVRNYVYSNREALELYSQVVENISYAELSDIEAKSVFVDECCLAFDLKVKHASKYSERFYKECVLYRDVNSGLHFEATFSPESSKSATDKAKAVSAFYNDIMDLLATLPKVFSTSLVKIMEWVEISVEELAEKSRLSDRTIRRLRTQDDYNVNFKDGSCYMHRNAFAAFGQSAFD